MSRRSRIKTLLALFSKATRALRRACSKPRPVLGAEGGIAPGEVAEVTSLRAVTVFNGPPSQNAIAVGRSGARDGQAGEVGDSLSLCDTSKSGSIGRRLQPVLPVPLILMIPQWKAIVKRLFRSLSPESPAAIPARILAAFGRTEGPAVGFGFSGKF